MEEVNKKFNDEIQQQIDGTLPVGHVYQFGHPGEILRLTGVDELPIELESGLLHKKSSDGYHGNHPFDLSEIKDLPKAINNPIAVFDDDSGAAGGKRILTELQHNGSNFLVAMRTRTDKKSRKVIVTVNSIRSIFPKDRVDDVFDWFYGKNDLLRWVDKEKARKFVSIQSTERTADGNDIRAQKALERINGFKNPSKDKILYAHEKVNTQVKKLTLKTDNPSAAAHDRAHAIAHKAAVDAADRLIRRTQPQYDKVLQPEALRNAGLIGSNMFLTQQNQNINNLLEINAGRKGTGAKGFFRALGQALGQVVLPSVVFRTLSTGKWGLIGAGANTAAYLVKSLIPGGDDPDEELVKALQNVDEWEDYIDVLAEYTLGGIPLVGYVPIALTRLGTNEIRNLRGRKRKAGGFIGVSPIVSFYEDIIKTAGGEGGWWNAGRFASQMAGVPGWTQGARVVKAVKEKDPLGAVWSKKLREDTGVMAEMVKRANRGPAGKEWEKYDEWYQNASDETAARYERYYIDKMNELAENSGDEEDEFKLVYRNLPAALSYRGQWARARYSRWSEGKKRRFNRMLAKDRLNKTRLSYERKQDEIEHSKAHREAFDKALKELMPAGR